MTTPTVIRIPCGKWVSIGEYARVWKYLLSAEAMPNAEYPGWDYFPTDGRRILANMREMLMDVINRHDRTMWREQGRKTCLGARIRKKQEAAARRGVIRFECRWCGSQITPGTYLPEHARFCDVSCQRSFYS